MKKTLLVLMMVTVALTAVAVQDDAILYRGAGSWFGNYSVPGGFGVDATVDTTLIGFGLAGATPLVGDINGDGIGDVVVAQVSGGGYQWVAAHSVNDGSGKGLLSSATTSTVNPFGTVAGSSGNLLADVNGDGIQDIITINSGFNWYTIPSTSAGIAAGTLQGPAQFGLAGDQPICGDFDGDGNDDIGIYRIASGGIYWNGSAGGVIGAGVLGPIGQIGGAATDSLLIGNLNGDAYADAVMVRQTGAGLIQWFGLINTTNASGVYGFLDYFNPGTTIVNFGNDDGTDMPMLGDINGDGYDDIVVNRGGTAFYAAFTTAGGALGSTADDILTLGLAGDIPILGSIKLVPEPGIIGLLSLLGLAILRRK